MPIPAMTADDHAAHLAVALAMILDYPNAGLEPEARGVLEHYRRFVEERGTLRLIRDIGEAS